MKRRTMALIAAGVFALDRVSKILLKDASAAVIPGLVSIRGTRNTGMALSLFSGGTAVITGITAALLTALVIIGITKPLGKTAGCGLALIAGGAAGNLLDRILYGAVIDFLDLHFFICNIADIAVTFGVILVGIVLLFGKESHGNEKV